MTTFYLIFDFHFEFMSDPDKTVWVVTTVYTILLYVYILYEPNRKENNSDYTGKLYFEISTIIIIHFIVTA